MEADKGRQKHTASWAWPVGMLMMGFAAFAIVALRLIARLPPAGDEPWYLLQAVALARYHTPDLAPVLRDHVLYQHLLGAQVDDHTYDYVGNGERMLTYLPGYAALIAPLYALGGRALVVIAQAAAAALTGMLVYIEAWRLFHSRAVALLAWLAYLAPLPVALYAGQLFPSTLAACALMLGYVAAVRWLPGARGWRLLAASGVVGLLVAALPWLHIKYALAGLALAGIALVALLVKGDEGDEASFASAVRMRERWIAAALLGGVGLIGYALVAVYSRHYFGAWTPPNSRAQANLGHPQLGAVGAVYADMFLSSVNGLLPWVPLDLLVVPGVVVVWRRYAWRGRALAVVLVAQLGTYVTAAFSAEGQGKAMPGRFTLECAPFFAVCVAAAVVPLLPSGSLRRLWRAVRVQTSDQRHILRGLGVAGVLALLLVTAWFAAVGRGNPALLYPGPSGPNLVARYPNALPHWWFGAFPPLRS